MKLTVSWLMENLLGLTLVGLGSAIVVTDRIRQETELEDIEILVGICLEHGWELHIVDKKRTSQDEQSHPMKETNSLERLLDKDAVEFLKKFSES